ncbi:hypothetical protein DV738_g2222, partial [Chaetothyriales sp. CBS 135597]
MQCSLPPHATLSFCSIEAFEAHYAKEHSNRCARCQKNFPSAHLLGLHLDEHHNPLREELEAKGEKTYGCFVEGCGKLCSSRQKRRLHLIDKHAFPRLYNFRVTETGIDKSTSMLLLPQGRRRLSTPRSPPAADTPVRHPVRLSQPIEKSILRQSTTAAVAAPPVMPSARPDTPDGVDELAQSMSALRFVPPSVTRQQGRKTGE